MKRIALIMMLAGMALAQTPIVQYTYPAAPSKDPGYVWYKTLLIKTNSIAVPCPSPAVEPTVKPDWAVCSKAGGSAGVIRAYLPLVDGGTQTEPFNLDGAAVIEVQGKNYIFSIQEKDGETYLTFAPEVR